MREGCLIGNGRREDEGHIHINQAVRVVANHIANKEDINVWLVKVRNKMLDQITRYIHIIE